ncbi:GH16 domain-containing protein [Mycena kentingensis (nom. inval.)]|nr:GH16 domain-containing protein [Mycena kentingensis (nom. inval.)]
MTTRYGYKPVSIEGDDAADAHPSALLPGIGIRRSTPSRSRSRDGEAAAAETTGLRGPRANTSAPRTRSPSPAPPATDSFDVDFRAQYGHRPTGSSTSLLALPPQYQASTPSSSSLPLSLVPGRSTHHDYGHSPSSSTSTLPSSEGDVDSADDIRIEAPRALPAPTPRSGTRPRSMLVPIDPYAPPPPMSLPPLPTKPARPRFQRAATSGQIPGHRRGASGFGSGAGQGLAVSAYRTSATSSSSFDFSAGSRPGSMVSEKFDPTSHLYLGPEEDDLLHDPRVKDTGVSVGKRLGVVGVLSVPVRGLLNLGCLLVLVGLLAALFIIYPLHLYFVAHSKPAQSLIGSGGGDAAGVNASGQVPEIGNWGLVDLDTPKDAYTIRSFHDPSKTLQLVFSDEFETEQRSFYPGDDPYWEALDLHYWATGNLEWYDPSAITTRAGALEITLSRVADPALNHDLEYKGGMMSSWNKFCFTGGLILADVMLPGANNVFGLWPALWTMGNLGRAGYGATLDGTWPYSYDACDAGAAPNQSYPDTSPLAPGPAGATLPDGSALSFQPGQRLSRCVCAGESHPGPVHDDGTFVGRSAPEIDIFEAQIGQDAEGNNIGQVSQSAQWAPFNAEYTWNNSTDNLFIKSLELSHLNSYKGGVYQQPTSVVTTTKQDCYQLGTGCFASQGFEYVPGFDNGYITWVNNDDVAWTLNVGGVGADTTAGTSARPIPEEPLYILVNLGISHSFGFVDIEHLVFPATMRIDWIRVYQDPDRINIGCDPKDRPTSAYINTYIEAYTNPNLTTWHDDFKQPIPRNSLAGDC